MARRRVLASAPSASSPAFFPSTRPRIISRSFQRRTNQASLQRAPRRRLPSSREARNGTSRERNLAPFSLARSAPPRTVARDTRKKNPSLSSSTAVETDRSPGPAPAARKSRSAAAAGGLDETSAGARRGRQTACDRPSGPGRARIRRSRVSQPRPARGRALGRRRVARRRRPRPRPRRVLAEAPARRRALVGFRRRPRKRAAAP